ncbi:MAG: hypothetical protein IPF99_35135 [Deltaproteobacteria bacterium]|nr:hypothetical protein [Deltaproteobacteria bacterium]
MPRAEATTARPSPPGLFSAIASEDELAASPPHGLAGLERWAWCVGFVFDAFALWVIWPGGSWPVVLLSRALGVPLQPLVSWLARTRRLPVPTVGYLTLLYTVVTVALMAIPAIEFGGLTSPYVFSLVAFAMAAPLVADLRRSRLFALFASWFVTWTALLAAASLTHPAVARQWTDDPALTLYLGQWLFLALTYVAKRGGHAGDRRAPSRAARGPADSRATGCRRRLGAGGA